MPESTSIVCDLETCAAWALPSSPFCSFWSNSPPSRLKDNWTLVSLVSRLIVAVRAILKCCVVATIDCWVALVGGAGKKSGRFDVCASDFAATRVFWISRISKLRIHFDAAQPRSANMSQLQDEEMADASVALEPEDESTEVEEEEEEPVEKLIRVVRLPQAYHD